MAQISLKSLAVFINLLSLQVGRYNEELARFEAQGDKLDEQQIEDKYEWQLTLQQYNLILAELREEYELGLADGTRLPSFEELTRGPSTAPSKTLRQR